MPGFDFSNHTRNAALHARGVPLPKATSTGTTIVGCIFDGGVVVSFRIVSDLGESCLGCESPGLMQLGVALSDVYTIANSCFFRLLQIQEQQVDQ